jgi:hypothetical protein
MIAVCRECYRVAGTQFRELLRIGEAQICPEASLACHAIPIHAGLPDGALPPSGLKYATCLNSSAPAAQTPSLSTGATHSIRGGFA